MSNYWWTIQLSIVTGRYWVTVECQGLYANLVCFKTSVVLMIFPLSSTCLLPDVSFQPRKRLFDLFWNREVRDIVGPHYLQITFLGTKRFFIWCVWVFLKPSWIAYNSLLVIIQIKCFHFSFTVLLGEFIYHF